jgi:hypothetical protein
MTSAFLMRAKSRAAARLLPDFREGFKEPDRSIPGVATP